MSARAWGRASHFIRDATPDLKILRSDFAFIALLAALDWALLAAASMRVVWVSEIPVAVGTALLATIHIVYRFWRPTPALAHLAADALRFVLFTNVACVLSYTLTTLSPFPLHDALFDHLDTLLGFHWLGYAQYVSTHPWLHACLHLGYLSAVPQLVVLIVLCALRGTVHLRRMLYLGFVCTAILTITLGALLPATGAAWFHHWVNSSQEPLHQYLLLRRHRLHEINLFTAQGLVWFPSFHAALAGLYLWVAFHLRGLRWPFVVLNIAMLAATPLFGGHYLVDILVGLIIVSGVLWGLSRCNGRMGSGVLD